MKRQQRQVGIRIMVTAQEHHDFMAMAKERHTTLSEIVRQFLHREHATFQLEKQVA